MRSPRQARWLLLGVVDELHSEERLCREQLLQADEELRGALQLTEEFGRIVRTRIRFELGSWLEEAEKGTIGEFRQFAFLLWRDLAAVEAALTYEWSNGQMEGQISRLKPPKRRNVWTGLPALVTTAIPACSLTSCTVSGKDPKWGAASVDFAGGSFGRKRDLSI